MTGGVRFSVALAMTPVDQVLDLARGAEAAGWDGICLPDSIFWPQHTDTPYPYSPDGSRFWDEETHFVDPLVAIPAMAAVTERLTFSTNVLKTPIREPLALAKQVSTIAALSNNRFALGVGLSWMPEEFAWTGTEKRTRGVRLDEQIAIVRACCDPATEWAEFHGEHYDFDALKMRPRPTQQVPIIVGGLSDAGLRRAATVGDGWVSVMNTEDELREIVPKLHALRAEAGRTDADTPTGRFEVQVTPLLGPDVDAMCRIAEIGVTDIMLIPWLFRGVAGDDVAGKVESLHWFREEVMEPVRQRVGAAQ